MKVCLFALFFLTLAPVFVRGQGNYTVAKPGGKSTTYGETGMVSSNVPLNEINIHAFRRMHRRYPGSSGEYWLKTAEGYLVSFMEHSRRYQACFSLDGAWRSCFQYYAGKDAPAELTHLIDRKYPGYAIKVVTEITDGNTVFYRVNIENSSSVKTLSIIGGQVEVLEELINGGINNGPGR